MSYESRKLFLGVPTEGGAFQLTVGTSSVQLSEDKRIKSVTIKADDDNTGNIYVGFSSTVSSSNGFRLKAGQGIEIMINNLNKIWVVADEDNQKVHILWVK